MCFQALGVFETAGWPPREPGGCEGLLRGSGGFHYKPCPGDSRGRRMKELCPVVEFSSERSEARNGGSGSGGK